MEFWNQRTFCLITGASRGIGRCIAVEFGKKVGAGSVLVLVARSAQGLQETKSELDNAGIADIKIVTATLDLEKSETSDYLNVINTALINTGTSAGNFEHSLLVHNAATVNDSTLRAIQNDNTDVVRAYIDLNLNSMIVLTSQFFKIFHDAEKQRTLINISDMSSPSGGQIIYKMYSLYCICKAARETFMKSVAVEDPSIACINYCPGAVDTDMLSYVTKTTTDPELRQQLDETVSSGRVLAPIQTVAKLIAILESKKFTKAEHVDYYDDEDPSTCHYVVGSSVSSSVSKIEK